MYLRHLDTATSNTNKHENRREFNISTYCVNSLYISELYKYKTGTFAKVRLNLYKFIKNKNQASQIPLRDMTDEQRKKTIEKGDHHYHNFIDNLIDVIIIHRRFDFENWYKSDNSNRKRLLIEEIHKAMLILAENFNWKKEPLEIAYKKSVKANYENNWTVKQLKTKSSPSRKYKAEIFVEYDLDEFRVFAVFYNKSGNKKKIFIHKINLLNCGLLYVAIGNIVQGKTRWQKNEFVLFDKKNTEIIRIKADELEF